MNKTLRNNFLSQRKNSNQPLLEVQGKKELSMTMPKTAKTYKKP